MTNRRSAENAEEFSAGMETDGWSQVRAIRLNIVSQIMELQRDGYTILRGLLSGPECLQFIRGVDDALREHEEGAIATAKGGVVGGRNLLTRWRGWLPILERDEVKHLIRHSVGENAGFVRLLYFDKPPGHSWALPLHRDRTIAVSHHPQSLLPFSKPTTKAGTPHVEASEELLQRMLTIRIHLDPMCKENGPLFVVPQSHRRSDVSDSVDISCSEGDMFVMRPLLLHGSHAALPATKMHRRILHFEIAPDETLPGDFAWHHFEPVFPPTPADHFSS